MSESWMTFVTRIEETPVIMFVDGQFADTAPVETMPKLLRMQINLREPDANGFPSEAEQTLLDQLEARIMEIVSANLNGVYVGRMTFNGMRTFCSYASTDENYEALTTHVMESFSDYAWGVDTADDPAWSMYREQLLPTKYDKQSMKNAQVVNALFEAGDQIDQPRDVRHWAYFPTDEARQAYIQRVTDGGMTVESQSEHDDKALPFGVATAMNHAVAGMYIDDLTCGLLDIAEDLGGEYDGWESPVVKA